jgi:alpha/beta superfamily hydrolase
MPAPAREIVVEVVRFPGGDDLLEGELAYPAEGRPRGAAVLAGPHPLLGGSRHNNVVRALGDGLAGRGLATLRFDYHGKDGDLARQMAAFWQSSHVPDEGKHGEDLRAAVAFLLETVGVPLPLALIGYSFGCSLLPGAVPPGVPTALVLIAPTVGKHDLGAFAPLPQAKLVIAAHDDFALDEKQLSAWLSRLRGPKEMVRPSLDGHFFRDCEGDVETAVAAFLDRQWRAFA